MCPFFQDILLGSVRRVSPCMRNLVSTIGQPWRHWSSCLVRTRNRPARSDLFLLVLTTKFDLQDLSRGQSGLTSLLPCLVPKSSSRIPGHPVIVRNIVFRAMSIGSEEGYFHILQSPLLQSRSIYVGLRHRG